MRYLYLLPFLLFCSMLAAQNWFPIVPNDQFSFRHSNSSLISNILQIDSQQSLPNGDHLFFLNRIVTDCDTCITQPGKWGNQGQFLQKTIVVKPDGRWVFSGKNTFVLFPQAAAGENWLLDTTLNVTASVQNITAQEVLGEADSVKTIALSDSGQILLSRNHGMLQFPDGNTGANFELKGIATRNLGEKLPGWLEFYDFEPGDELEYVSNLSTAPGTPENLHTIQKRRILNRYMEEDTLVYVVELFVARYFQFSGPPFPFYSHTTTNWRIHPHLAEPQTNGFPLQFFAVEDGPDIHFGSRIFWTTDTTYGLGQVFGVVQMPFQWEGCALFRAPSASEESVLPCDGCGTSFHRRHSVGLGLTSHTNSCFESWDYGQLSGWIKNGDTTGVLTPDSVFLVSLQPEPLAIPVRVAPNPAGMGDWNLYFPETTTENLSLDLHNLHGQRLYSGVVGQGSEQKVIPGSNIPAGVYLLKIQGNSGVKTLRLIKE